MEVNRKAEAAKISKMLSEVTSDVPAEGFLLGELLTRFSQRLYTLQDLSNRLTSAVLRLDSDALSEDVCCEKAEDDSMYRGAIPKLDQQLTDFYKINNTISSTLNRLDKYI